MEIFNYKIFNFISGDKVMLEREPSINWQKKQLMAYKHYGFRHCMDTMRDKKVLSDLWKKKHAPWKKK